MLNNPAQHGDKPIEVNFKFPKQHKTLISSMQFKVGDKCIVSKIMEKEKTK